MFPYQIYQVLTEQRMRDLRAEARHHELVSQALLAGRNRAEPTPGLKDLVVRLGALVHISARAGTSGPRARSAITSRSTSTSSAGPMGCNA
jgi:hypothetical protein